MTIVNNKFAAEFINKNRKAYKFDDIQCLIGFVKQEQITKGDLFNIYINDFLDPGELIPYDSAFYLIAPDFRSPMGGNIAAFSTLAEMESQLARMDAEVTTIDEIFNIK